MKSNFREYMFRIWYWYVNRVDKNAEILFMNFGFSDPDHDIPLDKENEPNRYSIQLYHHLAIEAEIENKNIVEIGCCNLFRNGLNSHYILLIFTHK